MAKLSGTELQDAMSNTCNSYLPEVESFIEALKKDHRTLQQNQIRFMLQVIEAMAEVKNTDARNEGGVLMCKNIVDAYTAKNGYKPSKGLATI
jgi:hypothetical protein